jgi:hypothetical protein
MLEEYVKPIWSTPPSPPVQAGEIPGMRFKQYRYRINPISHYASSKEVLQCATLPTHTLSVPPHMVLLVGLVALAGVQAAAVLPGRLVERRLDPPLDRCPSLLALAPVERQVSGLQPG